MSRTWLKKKWEDMRVEEKLEYLRGEYSKVESFAVETHGRVDDFSASKRPSLRALEIELDQLLERFNDFESRLTKLEKRQAMPRA